MTGIKKILLVTNGFFPEISPRSYRATELAKEFCRQGHEVTVITKYREHDYTGFLQEFRLTFKMWKKSTWPPVNSFKQRHLSVLSRIISRMLSVLFEYPAIEDMFSVKRILGNEAGYDMMISFSVPYPVHWGVAWSRSEKHRIAGKWVADCGDPYMGDVLDSFRKPFYFKYLEKSFCKKADYISIPVESAKPGYYPEFHFKISVIPQGFDFILSENEPGNLPNEIPTFAYAGGFLPGARDPGPLMDYLVSLDLPFKFIVYTNRPDFINEYRLKMNGKLVINDYIPRSQLLEVMKKMDFLINFDNNTRLNSPSKLIDYAIVKKPVINIDRNFKGEELLAFIKGDYRNQMLLPDPQQFHIKNIAKKFLDLLNI